MVNVINVNVVVTIYKKKHKKKYNKSVYALPNVENIINLTKLVFIISFSFHLLFINTNVCLIYLNFENKNEWLSQN